MGLAGASRIAAGADHACAIAGGQLRCWGDNSEGEIGDGTSGNDRPAPRLTAMLTVTGPVAAADNATCAQTATGLSCWGDNSFGQLGNGTLSVALRPVEVAFP